MELQLQLTLVQAVGNVGLIHQDSVEFDAVQKSLAVVPRKAQLHELYVVEFCQQVAFVVIV